MPKPLKGHEAWAAAPGMSMTMAMDADGNVFFGGWMYEDFTANTVNGPVTLTGNGDRNAGTAEGSDDGDPALKLTKQAGPLWKEPAQTVLLVFPVWFIDHRQSAI